MTDVSSAIQVNNGRIKIKLPKGDFEQTLVPEGRYDVMVARCKDSINANGNLRLTFALEIAGGDHKGQWVWTDVYLTEKALFRFVQVIEALTGEPYLKDEIDCAAEDFVGLRCSVDVAQHEWNEKTRNEVTAWYASAPELPRLQESEIPF